MCILQMVTSHADKTAIPFFINKSLSMYQCTGIRREVSLIACNSSLLQSSDFYIDIE